MNFNVNSKQINQDKLKDLFLGCLLLFFVCHAYCFLNMTFNHDSMNNIYRDHSQNMWQIQLGRIFQPINTRIEGNITPPLLLGTLSFLYSLVAMTVVGKLLRLRNNTQTLLAYGFLISSTTIVISYASFITWSSIYMLCFLLNVMGAYIAIRCSKRYAVFAVMCFIGSLGLYQAYIQVGVVLMMFDVALDLINDKKTKDTLKKVFFYVALIIITLVLYKVLVDTVIYLCNTKYANSYNSIAGVGTYDSLDAVVNSFVGAYAYVFKSFLHPVTQHVRLVVLVRITLLVTTLYCLVRLCIHNKISKANATLLVVILLLLPFGFNFVYFLSKGMEHELMTYSFYVVPLFVFCLLNAMEFADKKIKAVVYACFAFLIFDSIIYANQCYVRKNLECQATMSVMTRIIDRIEQTEGYLPGKTSVCFYGCLESNPLLFKKREGFDYETVGMGGKASVTYGLTIINYFNKFLAYPCKVQIKDEAARDSISRSLQAFPNKNCTKIIDDVLYIKVAE